MLDSVTPAATAYLKERNLKTFPRTRPGFNSFLPNVNNRNRLGEDSTKKVGTAEVDKQKVVNTFQKLFPMRTQ